MNTETIIAGDPEGFHVAVQPSFGGDKSWSVILCKRNHGWGLSVGIADRAKAERIARYLYDELKPEHDREQDEQKALSVKMMQQLDKQAKRRDKSDAAKRKRQLAKITPQSPRVTKLQCEHCEEVADAGEFDVPIYECSRCSSRGRGDDERRCDQCGIFRGKESDRSCPSCEEAVEETESVVGVEVDGEFIEEAELPENKRANPSQSTDNVYRMLFGKK